MTTLRNGRILVPYTELSKAQTVSTVKMLTSNDDGHAWNVIAINADLPLSWWVPYGKIIEATNPDTLILPVFGAASPQQLEATIHHCGLLRSQDGGEIWSDFSSVAHGGDQVHGASKLSFFSFEAPSITPLSDGRWLAMVTGRRLNRSGDGPTTIDEGPGAPQVICRLWSTDQGRTWTKPDLLAPGAYSSVVVIDNETLCARTQWCAWGNLRIMTSRDGFETFYQEMRLTTRE